MTVTWIDTPGQDLTSRNSAIDFSVDVLAGLQVAALFSDGVNEELIWRDRGNGPEFASRYLDSTVTTVGGGGVFALRRKGGWPQGVNILVTEAPVSAVSSVFTRTGAIVATSGDYEASQVSDTTSGYGGAGKTVKDSLNSAKSDAAAASTAASSALTAANAAGISQLKLTALKSGTYTAAANELVPCDVHAGAFPVTLPAVSANRIVGVFLDGTISPLGNVLTVSPASGTIDGRASLKLRSQGEIVVLQSDGTNWRVLDWAIPSAPPSLGALLSPQAAYILGATPLTDLSGNSRTMTLETTAGFKAVGIDGTNTGIYVDGTRVGWSQKCTNAALRSATALTLEIVFNMNGQQLAGQTDCFDLVGTNGKGSQNDGAHNNQGTLSYNGADLATFFGGLFAFQENGGSEIIVSSDRQLSGNQLYHVLGSRASDGKTWTFCANGLDIATVIAANAPTSGASTDFRIGSCSSASGTGNFQGTYYSAGIWTSALTQDQRYWLARQRLGSRGYRWQGQ